MTVHLLKLAVGIESIADLRKVQKERRARRRAEGDKPGTWHFTRNFPRRAEEVLDGGSMYWVIRGEIVARQRILALEEHRRPGRRRRRCAIRLAAEVVPTEPVPHRAMQGWRYLRAEDAPADLKSAPSGARGAERLPASMARELRELGLL